MLISELNDRGDILSQASSELKALGISVRSVKSKQVLHKNKRSNGKNLFKGNLHNLELAEGILSNGSVCEIPKFVLLACTRIQDEPKTVGIFRKTGSFTKQKQIQEQLERGGSVEKHHSVIDIANLLKKFLRDIPSPLVPQSIQDSLISCLVHCSRYEHKLEAILMTCLFLPPIAINTLAYFLQFLEVITKNSQDNLMTVDNLVKILTPTIMPGPENVNERRLQNLFKIMEMLITNANLIGVVPDRMIKREDMMAPPMTEERKKKKRRSASLNRVFDGFRKRFGGAIAGSSEELDKSHEKMLDNDMPLMTPNITKSAKKRRLEKLDISAFSSKKKKDQAVMTLSSLPEIDDNLMSVGSPYGSKKREEQKLEKKPSFKLTQVHTNNHVPVKKEEDYVRVSKYEYEAFKNRLHTIETRINEEFQAVKLNSVKTEMGKANFNGPEKVENKFHETLQEVEKIEDSERNTAMLAKRLSRELKIRPHIENPVIRSPSARKIGSLRRKQDAAPRLSRVNSWHISTSHDNATKTAPAESTTFYPQPNLKRLRMLDTATTSTAPIINLPVAVPVEKVIPEKPVRKTAINSLSSETWTSATDFFKDFEPATSTSEPQPQEEIFKTPVRVKKLQIKGDIDINKTPMLPPRFTTPISEKKSVNRSILMTPSLIDSSGREARASIIQIRNQNAGQVAQKAKLFDKLTDNLFKSVEKTPAAVKLPRVAINKKLETVKSMTNTPNNLPSNVSPRRSSRSPGITRRLQLRVATQKSPMLKAIKENRGSKVNLIKNKELLAEIASPRESRKALSQNNTPRRAGRGNSYTPSKSASAKKHRTPTATKSPRSVTRRRHQISFD